MTKASTNDASTKLAWRPEQAEINAIAAARHGDPFAVLGPHVCGDGVSIRVMMPAAERVDVLDESGRALAALEKLHDDGFFAGLIEGASVDTPYRLRFTHGEAQWEEEDAYRFPLFLGELDVHLLAEGTHRRLYEKLGAHPVTLVGAEGVVFAVWAPNARRVSVVGDFNGWDGRRHPMRKRHEAGVWELFIPGVQRGASYKYEIIGVDGTKLPLKADPLAFAAEVPPSTASRVHGLVSHDWGDDEWVSTRGGLQDRSGPISIYEVHLGSWRRGESNSFLHYDRLADELIPYVRDLGFTHIELLPISEYPFSGSWGYQPVGLFAPTSRFGDPNGFARFVDRCHANGIGVLVDWVPAHFPSDPHGLARFDGTALYEHEDPRLGFHKDWNTLIYNFGRQEVANFLESNALFWLDRYHVDGLRVDAVASMLYRDYSRDPGEWVPNVHGGRENLEAVSFLRDMNTHAYGDFPSTITVAEESTAWPGVSRPVDVGGLGFGFKWNMGWMHDTLSYMARDPMYRSYHHNEMTFGLIYAYSENFILPLSHDEVVHGKGSLLAKMPGDRWQKFANLRAYLAFMWTHPGKKLLFMGGEFGQEREWNHDQSLDWHLLADPSHRGIQSLVRDLNKLYRSMPALHELDCEPSGFEWVDGGNTQQSLLSYIRKGKAGSGSGLVVCNFTPQVHHGRRFGVPAGGRWIERLNSDSETYGGSNVGNLGAVDAQKQSAHGRPYSVEITVPPLATIVLEHADA
ncbi:1,4-alpha-glucan branching protein GlgB [Methyloceanibacter caenitepidi]|uniref:1,4-alpha-glucan branching enzyme GlgB n=1 Tax=Methyloceanibacter caenitepidi TaxID=1384459 RepID=A0A0A8JZ49_9HYPH|nr:1,4-alpha-glucan branching protein GlgB [Methyloceanibacter caenitepidi]BAQ15612.1 1,4-alpha-glucan (glycogen) branching enzyme, GH-13-type [Methyloceanibacter caenitepidi]